MAHMTETSALFTAASVAVVTWIALFGYLMKIDTALRRLEDASSAKETHPHRAHHRGFRRVRGGGVPARSPRM